MKTRLEIVKQAYGDEATFEFCKPDPFGWTSAWPGDTAYYNDSNIEKKIDYWGNLASWRPSSLKGLEENNGWNLLEEKDFPKKSGHYDFLEKGTRNIHSSYYSTEASPEFHQRYLNLYSHWTVRRELPRF